MPSRGQQLGKLLNSSGDIAETSLPPKIETFSQSVSNTGKIEVAALGDDVSTIEQVSDTNSLSASGNAVGDQRVVGNTLYLWNGSGWYRIALINETPTWDSGGQPSVSYILDRDSPQDATIITLAASDPDGLPITYSYITGGSMDSMATISQDSSVFTITPKTVAQVGEGVELTGSITFRASDGVNILPHVSSFTLDFVFIIQNSKYTTLLATAVDTSDNNTIVDSSSNNETITVYGNPSAGTFSPYRHGGYSTYFDGTGDYLGISASNDWGFGNGAWTIEFWVNTTDTQFDPVSAYYGASPFTGWTVSVLNGAVRFYASDGVSNSGYVTVSGSTTINDGQWHHVALTSELSSNAVSCYVDGTLAGSATLSVSPSTTGQALWIGIASEAIYNLEGYLADVRIVKGTAVYTSNFTPPTERLTAVANTSLLTCHLPYIADGSSNAHSITVNGDTSVKPFTPYDNLKYSAVDHGGSIYFDQGSNLTLADNDNWDLTSSNFTIKFWVYMQQDTFPSGYIRWIDDAQTTTSTQGNWTLGVQSNKQVRLTIWDSSGTLSNIYSGTSKLIHNNRWYYVEWSGGTVKVNGETYISYTHPNTGAIGGNMVIGSGQNHAGTREAYMKGYIADLHFVNGSTAAESSIPTAPMSSVSDTKLLIKGTEASIIDKSQSTNLQLVGNTTGSTTEVKFADTKSIYFNPSATAQTNYIDVSNIDGNFGTGDFTIEGWIRPASIDTSYSASGNSPILDLDASSGTATDWWVVHQTGSSIQFGTNQAIQHSGASGSLTANTWHHFAVARENGTIRIFVDGSETGASVSYSTAIGSTRTLRLAGQGGSSRWWEGYMSDIRITKGLARYTANFTPPTEPFKG